LKFSSLRSEGDGHLKFKKTVLNGANLMIVRLIEANLQSANLVGADLEEANFLGANFEEANFGGANLERVNLRTGNLQRANLEGANLEGANLEGVQGLTIEQLSKVKSLYGARLDPALLEQVKEKYPHLLEEPI